MRGCAGRVQGADARHLGWSFMAFPSGRRSTAGMDRLGWDEQERPRAKLPLTVPFGKARMKLTRHLSGQFHKALRFS